MWLHWLIVKLVAKWNDNDTFFLSTKILCDLFKTTKTNFSHMWHLQLKNNWKKLVINMQILYSDRTCNNISQSANIFFKWFK